MTEKKLTFNNTINLISTNYTCKIDSIGLIQNKKSIIFKKITIKAKRKYIHKKLQRINMLTSFVQTE